MNIDKMYETLFEAEEIPVVKDGDLKLPVDEIYVRDYDEQVGFAGRVRKPMIDWITEYNYVSKESLTEEQFMQKIKEAGHNPTGVIYKPTKRRLTFANGDIYYRHILKTATF